MEQINSLADHFQIDIEEMVLEGASYIDAIATWTEINGLEPELGAELAARHPLILARLTMEAESLNLIKKD